MMKTKTFLMSAILAVLALVGVIVYGVERIKTENESASVLINKSDEVNGANSVALATKKDKAGATANLAVLDEIEITQPEFVPFLETIEKTGRDLGLKIKIASVKADPATKVATSTKGQVYTPPQSIHITLGATGGWASNLSFVHALENLPHKVSLDSVTLNYNPPDKSQGNASTTGEGYWRSALTLTTEIYPN